MPLRRPLRTPAGAGGPRRLALLLAALLALWPLWLGAGRALGRLPFGGVDFKAYYLAGLRVRHGLPLYDPALVEAVPPPRAVRFLYPPAAALPFVPLSSLPPLPARVAFLAAQFALLWWAVVVLLRAYGHRPTRAETLAVGWLLAGVQPLVFVARIGNVTGVVAALLCLSAAATVAPEGPDRPFAGGALAALAAFPKPYVAPAGAHLLTDRRRLLGAAAAGTALVGAGLALFGPETTRAYLGVLLEGDAWGAPRPPGPTPWHYRPFARYEGVRHLLQAALLAAAAGTALAADRSRGEAAFALGCVAVPLVAPSADTLTLSVALPGVLVAWLRERRAGGRPAVPLAAGVALQTGVYLVRVVGHLGPAHLPGLPWAAAASLLVVHPATAGLLAVFGLCAARVWRARVRAPSPAATPVPAAPLSRRRRPR